MKVLLAGTGGDDFELTLGEAVIRLTGTDLRRLAAEIGEVLPPDEVPGLAARLLRADDIGLSRLLRKARHEDVVLLLSGHEDDGPLLSKVYGNMSARMARMVDQDRASLEAVPSPDRVAAALRRLAGLARSLERAGQIRFDPE